MMNGEIYHQMDLPNTFDSRNVTIAEEQLSSLQKHYLNGNRNYSDQNLLVYRDILLDTLEKKGDSCTQDVYDLIHTKTHTAILLLQLNHVTDTGNAAVHLRDTEEELYEEYTKHDIGSAIKTYRDVLYDLVELLPFYDGNREVWNSIHTRYEAVDRQYKLLLESVGEDSRKLEFGFFDRGHQVHEFEDSKAVTASDEKMTVPPVG